MKSERIAVLPDRRSRLPLRVSLEGRTSIVLVAEMSPPAPQHWEAARNIAFWDERRTGASANAVVLVPPGTLPRIEGGAIDSLSVITDFPRRRGYLREEVLAWVVNRLCEVLFLSPADFDPSRDWARYGVDSAVALEMVADLEDRLQTRLPQVLADSRNPRELVNAATSRLLAVETRLPWWRSPWAAVEGI